MTSQQKELLAQLTKALETSKEKRLAIPAHNWETLLPEPPQFVWDEVNQRQDFLYWHLTCHYCGTMTLLRTPLLWSTLSTTASLVGLILCDQCFEAVTTQEHLIKIPGTFQHLYDLIAFDKMVKEAA